jgi:hypothetical protein
MGPGGGVVVNPFQPSDAMWHHTFNSVLHMLQFSGLERVNPFQPRKCYKFFGAGKLYHFPAPQNCSIWRTELKVWYEIASRHWKGLRHCATSRKVPGPMFGAVIGDFFGSVRQFHVPGVNSAFKNEYQDAAGGKDGRCVWPQPTTFKCRYHAIWDP